MKIRLIHIILLSCLLSSLPSMAQPDTDPPVAPVLDFLTVIPESGWTELKWTGSPSSDVAGYVLYYYKNGEGFAFDTIFDPTASNYVNTGSSSSYRIESYVIAAIDTAGNVSPLSNELHTIFIQTSIDTCNNRISVIWNSYSSSPVPVTGYIITLSENGSAYFEAGRVSPAATSFILNNFETGVQCCFIVQASLEGGLISSSAKSCITTNMQRPPEWINADFATVNDDNNISVSFTIDPMSEIRNFNLERKTDTDEEFTVISEFNTENNTIGYEDLTAETARKYYYRLSAVNNCGIPVVFSNLAANIVVQISEADNVLRLRWDPYSYWSGGVSGYRILMNPGTGFTEKSAVSSSDTSYNLGYSDIMYEITGNELCFYIMADEYLNEFNVKGESRSNTVCSEIIERVNIANAFTPNGDLLNDLFGPVLSFTPADYHFVITDRFNNTLFETSDYLEKWDGKNGSTVMPQDVYLWYLKIRTPSGKIISRSGTVTIIINN
jgi:gliding motility-associated-like protein